MPAHRNHPGDGARNEIHARHAARLRQPSLVDPHEFREWIAALPRRAIPCDRLSPTEVRHIGNRPVSAHHGGHRQNAQRDHLEQRSALGVEHREGVVGGKRDSHDAVTGGIGGPRDGRRAGYEVAECGGCESHDGAVAVVRRQVRDRLRLRELLRAGDAAQRESVGQQADGCDERAAVHGIDGDALDSGAAVERSTPQYDVVTPAEAIGRAVYADPDLSWSRAEAHAKHPVGEHALDASRCDALLGGDDARVGDFSARLRRVLGWICGRL